MSAKVNGSLPGIVGAPKKEETSPEGKVILGRTRRYEEVDIGDIVGVASLPVKIRVPTKREQDLALVGALAYVAKISKETPSAQNSEELLNDAMGGFIISTAFRSMTEPEKWAVWASGEMVHSEMTSDQIGALVHLLNQVRAKQGPYPDDLNDERVEAFVTLASVASETDLPDMALAKMSHSYLVQLYILTACRLADLRKSIAETETDDSQA